MLAAAELGWFLLFPSLGLVQKYLGTMGTLAFVAVGFVLLAALAVRARMAMPQLQAANRRATVPAMAALFALLVVAFMVFYPLSNARGIGGGSDRDESLILGVRELEAGRYPYYERTPLENPVTQLPGSLLLAVPFALLGNAVWQNVFWLGAFFVVVGCLFGAGRVALGFLALTIFGSPVVLQDFVTGGDLGANALTILISLLLLVKLVPDPAVANWKKFALAIFAGIALSSRLNYLLLVPLVFAALARRAHARDAFTYVGVVGSAFLAITLPFYWHDPAGFAPLYLHNRFTQFEGEVSGGGWLFPCLSLLFSVLVSLYPGNRSVRVWLIQCGLVLTLPVVFLVALATTRFGRPNFSFTDYALAGVFFGGIGAGLSLVRRDPV